VKLRTYVHVIRAVLVRKRVVHLVTYIVSCSLTSREFIVALTRAINGNGGEERGEEKRKWRCVNDEEDETRCVVQRSHPRRKLLEKLRQSLERLLFPLCAMPGNLEESNLATNAGNSMNGHTLSSSEEVCLCRTILCVHCLFALLSYDARSTHIS